MCPYTEFESNTIIIYKWYITVVYFNSILKFLNHCVHERIPGATLKSVFRNQPQIYINLYLLNGNLSKRIRGPLL